MKNANKIKWLLFQNILQFEYQLVIGFVKITRKICALL